MTYYEHDAADRVIKVENLKSDLSVISSFEYQRDLLGNPLSVLREDSSCVYYEYDRNQQLTKETQTDDQGAVIYAWEWEYDAAGNRTWQGFNGVDTYYEYHNLNQLTQEATDGAATYYLYDRCGNQTAKTDGEGTTYFQWDHENLLTRIDFPDDTHSYFTYDADGKRIAKADADGYTRFIYRGPDMLALLQEKDDANDTVAHYTIGVGKGLESMRRGEASSFYHFDALGSTFNLTDALEAITDAYRFNAWGEVLSGTGTTPNPHGYVGRLRYYLVPEAGLLQLGVRYYGVRVGRFLSVDPLPARPGGLSSVPEPVSLHNYHYASGRPLTLADPTGQWWQLAVLAVLGVALVVLIWHYGVERPVEVGMGEACADIRYAQVRACQGYLQAMYDASARRGDAALVDYDDARLQWDTANCVHWFPKTVLPPYPTA